MISILNAISIASVFTASATLRFRLWKEPQTLILYFSFFMLAETALHRFFLPDIEMGIEVAYVFFDFRGSFWCVFYFGASREKRPARTEM